MHLLLPSDVFPPGSVGGAAWSSFTLAHALHTQGHTVQVVVPVAQPGWHTAAPPTRAMVEGVPVLRLPYAAPNLPIVQNVFRHERLWPRLARALIAEARRLPGPLLIHAQHVQTAPAAVLAARALGVPAVVTVRDHWPWDYFATGLHGDRIPYQPPPGWPARAAAMLTDLVARLGPLRGTLAAPALPYLLAHQRRRAALLAQADAVIAVSGAMAARLRGVVAPERLHVLPNMLDMPAIAAQAAASPATPDLPPRFLLFIGKLERNKGAGLLPAMFRAYAAQQGQAALADLPPLLLAGTGALQPALERELAALGVPVRWLGWVPHDETLRLLARCTALLFPSQWGEPLSRVLLEASAVGAPLLAMPTGGTGDIMTHGSNGLLAATPEAFARALARLLAEPALCQRLGNCARQVAQQRFATEAVLPQLTALYTHLLAAQPAATA